MQKISRTRAWWLAGAMLVLGWLALSVAGSRQAESDLKAVAWYPLADGLGMRLSNLQHRAGWLWSSGTVDVSLESACGGAPAQSKPVTARVAYKWSHLPLPTSRMRFKWKAEALGGNESLLDDLFGSQGVLEGSGSVSLGGELRSRFKLPELSWRYADKALQITPSRGEFTVGGQETSLEWKTDRLVVREPASALELERVGVKMRLNRQAGSGGLDLVVDHLGAGDMQADGARLAATAQLQGEKLDARLDASLRMLQAAGRAMNGQVLEARVRGVDAAAAQLLFERSLRNCAPDARADERMRDVSQRLLDGRLAAGVFAMNGQAQEAPSLRALLADARNWVDALPSGPSDAVAQ
ncbi:MAG: DUF945 family protein [Zoogloea sp.]|nr:DUF945 family protein [Zoogloea sp.]